MLSLARINKEEREKDRSSDILGFGGFYVREKEKLGWGKVGLGLVFVLDNFRNSYFANKYKK